LPLVIFPQGTKDSHTAALHPCGTIIYIVHPCKVIVLKGFFPFKKLINYSKIK
jgi:hypothetical protein